MAITVKDIHEKEFSKQVRGYNVDEVDDFLDELAAQLENMIKENRAALAEAEQAKAEAEAAKSQSPVVVTKVAEPVAIVTEEKPAAPAQLMDEPQYFKNLETTLRETLINGQRLADETVAEARKKANAMIASAEEQAAAILSSARAEAEKTNTESQEVKKAADEYRGKFLRLLEEQAHILKAEDSLFNT